MLYDPSTADALHSWLVKTLEPICDAEPDALATYIVALIKNDVQEHELRKEAAKQLDEFFENGASSFVDTLFAALRSKSYVPYTSTAPPYTAASDKSQDTGIPIPLDALISPSIPTSPDRGQKRGLDDDDRESRGPPKGPRLGNEAYFSRPHQNGHGQADGWQRGPMDGPRGDFGMNGQMGNGPRPFQAPNGRPMLPRGVCRDYHLKGFCSRGAMCKYSHDDAAFAPQVPFGGGAIPMPTGNLPFIPMYGGMPFGMDAGQSSTYDPNNARMDMRPRPPHQRVPTIPRTQNGEGETSPALNARGELPVIQDLTPARPREEGLMDVTTISAPNVPPISPPDVLMQPLPVTQPAYHNAPQAPPLSHSQAGIRPQRGGNSSYRSRGRGGRGTFGGTFGGDHQSFHNNEHGRDSKTIVVEKIPEDHLSLEAVNSWFKRFGTVTNVAVDASGGKALVSFQTHEEAYAAWKAEEAVFNNRFVKIFWHRPMEGQGGVGARALQASAPLVANMTAPPQAPAATKAETPKLVAPSASARPSISTSASSPALIALQAKQQLLEKHIAEQKTLMSKLGEATPEEKKAIMVRLRKLASEMKAPSTAVSTTPTPPRSTSVPQADDKERKARELLDMELDLHAKGTEEAGPAESEETNESLEEKLAKLRAEASALGITDTASSQSHAPSYRGFRGRGRGRARYRGAMRGGPPRGSMKLDNRTKTLTVKGVASHDPEVVQAVRSWYEASGQMASLDVQDDDSLAVTFNTRAAAEQALAKGGNIPSAGTVKLSWNNDTSSPPKATVPSPTGFPDKKPTALPGDRPLSPHPEDIPDENGWDNEEDGMGMF